LIERALQVPRKSRLSSAMFSFSHIKMKRPLPQLAEGTNQRTDALGSGLTPELRGDSEFKHGLNKATDIVTQNLTESFINLRRLGLASKTAAEFSLDHTERSLDIAALVVLLEKPLLVEFIVMIHPPPKSGLALDSRAPILRFLWLEASGPLRNAVALKRNVRHGLMVHNGLEICRRQVSLISGDFGHCEIAACRFNQPLEERAIISKAIRNLNRRDDVRFHAADQMDLDPITFGHEPLVAILRINPFDKAASRKARRVNGKIGLDRLQGQAAFFNESFEQRCQRSVFQVARNRIVVRGFGKMALVLSIAQIRHETTARKTGVHLKRARKDDVTKRQARASHLLFWFFHALAQLSEQLNKLFFSQLCALL